MAIQKMALVNLVGRMPQLDDALQLCLESGIYHPENALHAVDTEHGYVLIDEQNPYTPLNRQVQSLAFASDIKLKKTDTAGFTMTLPEIESFLSEKEARIEAFNAQIEDLKGRVEEFEKSRAEVGYLSGMEVSFEDIFACEYVKYRFGRLPLESSEKLKYYSDKIFFFFPERTEGDYVWGAYFAPKTRIGEIDDVFASLYFERVRIPEYAKGLPHEALAGIEQSLNQAKDALDSVTRDKNAYCAAFADKLQEIFSYLRYHETLFAMRGKVAVYEQNFYAVGFVPKEQADSFAEKFEALEEVSCLVKPEDIDPTLTVPVKLKNNKFTKPFEMFVNMYSLPSHKDIDPTGFVAITYTLLFGIMFGDLGQGLLISLLGFIAYKWKKMGLGLIMERIGISSAIFGFLYGSVFGYENALDWFYVGILKLPHKPIEVFDNATTNTLLLCAIGLGVGLIVISMCISIFLGFKHKNYEQAIFGHNGIAGLTLYLSLAAFVVGIMIPEMNYMNIIWVILGIVLPIFCIFFAGPLSKAVKGRKDFMPKSLGEYIAENFFEMFEYALSYLSNSMSFLRVGGFILSHAGMMSVVMTLSEMTTNGVISPIIVAGGNLFVMCLEGLIVGIQVLRLEFYEMFSRFYQGNGVPYEPVTVSYDL